MRDFLNGLYIERKHFIELEQLETDPQEVQEGEGFQQEQQIQSPLQSQQQQQQETPVKVSATSSQDDLDNALELMGLRSETIFCIECGCKRCIC